MLAFSFYFHQVLLNMQRLAGSEEVLPLPNVNQLMGSSAMDEIKSSIQASLLKVGDHSLSFLVYANVIM